jgi:replicative DNA helicase
VTRSEGIGARHQLLISSQGNRWAQLSVGKWLRQLGVLGQRAYEKRLPAAVFTLSNAQIATLVRHLWAEDGTLARRSAVAGDGLILSYATASAALAADVAALLLRLGIVARISTAAHKGYRPLHHVEVGGAQAQHAFVTWVGLTAHADTDGEITEALAALGDDAEPDALPGWVATPARTHAGGGALHTHAGGSAGMAHFGSAALRSAPVATGAIPEPQAHSQYFASDLIWDQVLASTPDGEEEVFDLTVPGVANWLADGLVSHNSGAIEQDADMILLIYREEVYDRNTTKKGIAEIDLVKHRNGEIGTFFLTFQGQYTRFLNYASDSYGEGVLR